MAAQRYAEAAAEFQKILDHRGIVGADPIGVLAHLQLGRVFALSGDKTKAKAAYEAFLALWKDADADIPILKRPKQSTRGCSRQTSGDCGVTVGVRFLIPVVEHSRLSP